MDLNYKLPDKNTKPLPKTNLKFIASEKDC